jgi:hypothetical protein
LHRGSMLWSQFSAIFAHFRQKKLAFILKTDVMITFLQKVAVESAKNANIFAKCFGKNIVKIITSVPGVSPILKFWNKSLVAFSPLFESPTIFQLIGFPKLYKFIWMHYIHTSIPFVTVDTQFHKIFILQIGLSKLKNICKAEKTLCYDVSFHNTTITTYNYNYYLQLQLPLIITVTTYNYNYHLQLQLPLTITITTYNYNYHLQLQLPLTITITTYNYNYHL